jgi:hypothetical protein
MSPYVVGERLVCLAGPGDLLLDTFGMSVVTGALELMQLQSMIYRDHLCCALADHDDNGVDVTARDFRHHAGIRNAQIFDAKNTQSRIYHATYTACAADVVRRVREVQGSVFQQRIARRLSRNMAMFEGELWWGNPRAGLIGARPVRHNVESSPHRCNHDFQINGISIIVHVDRGLNMRVGALQDDFALTARQFELDDQIDVFRSRTEHRACISCIHCGIDVELIVDQANIDASRHETDLRIVAVTGPQPSRKKRAGVVP